MGKKGTTVQHNRSVNCFNNAGKKIKINKILGTRGVLR
jgi:hypothetical protein